MNRIRRIRRPLAREIGPPGPDEPLSRQLTGQESRLAARFIQGIAAAESVAVGQTRPAAPTTNFRRRTMTVPDLLPHTIQLCIHCQHNPAGFWVSRTSDQTVRRPWCLSCCQDLDPACHHVTPFDP